MTLFKGFPPRPQPKAALPEPNPANLHAPMPTAVTRPLVRMSARTQQRLAETANEPPPGLTRERCIWELERIERYKRERAEQQARDCERARQEYRKRFPLKPPPRPTPEQLAEMVAYRERARRGAEPAPQHQVQVRVAAPPATENVGETHDEDGRLLIRRPVQPGPRPAPSVLTPEIEARALGPKPRQS